LNSLLIKNSIEQGNYDFLLHYLKEMRDFSKVKELENVKNHLKESLEII